jgi:iron complex transport system ATP-binding protein
MNHRPPANGDALDRQELFAGVVFERRTGSVVIRLDPAWQVLSSAVLGGGRRHARGIIHLQVPLSYSCARPERDLRSAARELGLAGPVIGLMTAVDLAQTQILIGHTGAGLAVRMLVTVGLRNVSRPGEAAHGAPGTINAVVLCEARLRDAAAVELALLLAEAKAAALVESDLQTPGGGRASGTSTDAVAVLWRRTKGFEIRHAGAATELGSLAGRMMTAAIATELSRRAGPDKGRSP